jgi:hypothetical protein
VEKDKGYFFQGVSQYIDPFELEIGKEIPKGKVRHMCIWLYGSCNSKHVVVKRFKLGQVHVLP